MKSYGQIAYETNMADMSEGLRKMMTPWDFLDHVVRDHWNKIGEAVAVEIDRRAAPSRWFA